MSLALPTQEPETAPRRGTAAALIAAMRPKQWTPKNVILFAGLLFTLDKHHPAAEFGRVVLGFVLFCLLSGVVYLVNDVFDRESDRQHPIKQRRPIASGELGVPVAVGAAIVFSVIGLGASFALGKLFAFAAAFYFVLALAYSFRLKHIVILDVLVVASGFVLRAVAGVVILHVQISQWLILCTFMLALFLALSKRRAELLATQHAGIAGTRPILEEYSADMLDQMIVIVTSACLLSYCLYTVESQAAGRHHFLMLTIPFVIYGILRYLYLMHRHMLGEAPDAIVLQDKPILVNIGLWGATTALIVTHVVDNAFSHFLH